MSLRPLVMLLALFTLACEAREAGQQAFEHYFDARSRFWDQVYPDGGETLYCGKRFGSRHNRSINIEHVLPMAWAMNKEGCRNRDECRESSRRFNQIEADMHNFYPSLREINKARGSHSFGYVKGERKAYGQCDFEVNRRARLVEPRPASRGNIARAMFYMSETYGLTIFSKQARVLKQWNREDPPDANERRRNQRIAEIQGTRNRFIDDPTAAEQLRF